MKNRITLISLIIILVLTIGCSSCGNDYDETHSDLEIYEIQKKQSTEYFSREIELSELKLNSISGIAKGNFQVYISDKKAGGIGVYNAQLESLKFHKENLISPSLLAFQNGEIFVVDEIQGKIIQFSEDFNVVDEFPLPYKDRDSFYLDIDIDDDTIYLTCFAAIHTDAHILLIDRDSKEITAIGEDFLGFIELQNGQYAINTLEAYRKPGEEGFKGGNNALYQIKGKSLEKVCSLIQGSVSGDFFFEKNQIIVYTAGWSGIDRYNLEGHYLETLISFSKSDPQTILLPLDDRILVLMPKESTIYEVMKK